MGMHYKRPLNFKNMKAQPRMVDFKVHIPNLEGDGVQEVITIQIPVIIDQSTGDELMTPEGTEMVEDTKARFMGLLRPEQIKEMRQRLDLTQREISRLLQSGEKSYTRWESGKSRPSRLVNVLLRLLNSGKISVHDLQHATSNDLPKREVLGWMEAWSASQKAAIWTQLNSSQNDKCSIKMVIPFSTRQVRPNTRNSPDGQKLMGSEGHRTKHSSPIAQDEVISPTA